MRLDPNLLREESTLKDQVLNREFEISEPIVPAVRHRVSWGAIIVGAVIALSLQMLLNLLGLGIGASSINVASGSTPGEGLAIGAGVWFAVAALISLFAGGWVSGRLAGIPNRNDGMLHGFATWSVSSILTVVLLSSAVGGIIGGSASMLGKLASASGQGVQAAGPALGDLVSQATGITPAEVKQQAGQLVSDPQFQAFIMSVVRNGDADPQARQNLIQLVSQKQGVSQDQASAAVNDWQQKLINARDQAKVKATAAADQAASGLAKTALWSFVALLLGAIAATIGGLLGARTILLPVRTV